MPQPRGYTLWIEAEAWTPGEWTPADGNTDVIVTFDDGSRWVATFFSYANICQHPDLDPEAHIPHALLLILDISRSLCERF